MKEIDELYDQVIVLKRNEFLKIGGTIDTNIYLVKNGSLKIYILDQENEHIIRFGYDQDLVVSLDSFLTEQASDFFIQALKKTVIHRISKNKFVEFINENEKNKRIWISILERLILQQLEREIDLLTTSHTSLPTQNVFHWLSHTKCQLILLFQKISNKQIANYLRMTPETLSRLKKA